MAYNARITDEVTDHRVREWANDRNVKPGEKYPAILPVRPKRNLKVKMVVAYGNDDFLKLRLKNGNNPKAFETLTRIGNFLFNTARNKHLIYWLKSKILWWKGNYIPLPLKDGQVALAENLVCYDNLVVVDEAKGKWVHIKEGTAKLTEVVIGEKELRRGTLVWTYRAGWIPKELTVKV